MANTANPMVTLDELTRCDPNRLPDALRKVNLAGFGVTDALPFITLFNLLIAQGNQGSSSTQASGTVTIATPNVADIVNVAVGGVTFTSAIADATSATTAANGVRATLNLNTTFAAKYIATNAAGVITIKPLRKGTGGNSVALASSVTGAGGTTATAGAATLAGATGVDDLLTVI